MKKNELDLSVLKSSFDTLSQCYEDYCAEKNQINFDKYTTKLLSNHFL